MTHDDPWEPLLQAAAQAYIEWAREYHYGEFYYLRVDRYFMGRILSEMCISLHRVDEVMELAQTQINEEIQRRQIAQRAKERLLGGST